MQRQHKLVHSEIAQAKEQLHITVFIGSDSTLIMGHRLESCSETLIPIPTPPPKKKSFCDLVGSQYFLFSNVCLYWGNMTAPDNSILGLHKINPRNIRHLVGHRW